MDCTPNSLAAAARCLCLDSEAQEATSIYLLCAWANGGGGGGIPDGALTDDQGVPILDSDGNFIIVNL